ncbi:Signal peptide peptidase-like 3 [Portunus trituberculatus]|uniref:Signal peptide peptidase-like 3 n=1 Tax=Portunus trituberculatus TaxID=210409 RepID=A0A5B7EHS1_PORTR|nr:Signal peptide peptidase-like 3 [Portunus trituberculatus]
MQALCLPLGASVSLLIMFFFFDSMQMLFAVCTAIIATVALAFLLLPMCQYISRPCSDNKKISFGMCGRFTGAEIMAFCLSVSIVCIWVMTGHWLLMDAMGMGLCVAFIAFVRLPSLKVSTLLLTGLLVYFHCSLIGYFLGLLTATVSSEVFKAAQPALLYLVPFTLLPLLTMAYLKGDLRRMWSEPFIIQTQSKNLDITVSGRGMDDEGIVWVPSSPQYGVSLV